MSNMNERLNIDQIDELAVCEDDIEMGMTNDREAKLQAIDRCEWNAANKMSDSGKKYYYNKEVENGEIGGIGTDRHLYSYTASKVGGNYNDLLSNMQVTKSISSPVKCINFVPRSQNSSAKSRTLREDPVNEMSPFKSGTNKVYRPNTATTQHTKKTMFHTLEKDLMPTLPYCSITNIKVGDKQFDLREITKNHHVGFIIYPNDDLYFGEIAHFKRHGKGIFSNFKNEIFYGEFTDDLLDGEGKYYYQNGNICVGNWSKGYFHGNVCVYNREKDAEYDCVYDMGNSVEMNKKPKSESNVVDQTESLEYFYREGYSHTDLIVYLNDFANGRISEAVDTHDLDEEGAGNASAKKRKLVRQETTQNAKKQAKHEIDKELNQGFEFIRELTNPNAEIPHRENDLNVFDGRDLNSLERFWKYFRGSLIHGKRNGIGEIVYSGGHHFKGEFEDDVAEGKGVFYFKNGTALAGLWRKGVMIEAFE